MDIVAQERAIERLLVRYATALDDRDGELLRSCLTPDVVVTYRSAPELVGVDAVVAYCWAALDKYSATNHQLSNVVIDLAGTDAATSTCGVRAEHLIEDDRGRRVWVVVGRYRDELRRTPQGWQIARRVLENRWDLTSEP